MHTLSAREARRIAVRAQLLDAYQPESLVSMVDHLTVVQIDPTNAIAPSADLVAWSRLGGDYSPSDLTFALERERSLVEYNSFIRPMADVGLMLATIADWPQRGDAPDWLAANARFRSNVLSALAGSGPLTANDIDDTADVTWTSTGWTNDRNVVQMLEFLLRLGEVAVAGRRGRHRLWDLAARVYPADLVVPPIDEARQLLAARRLTSLGIARAASVATPLEPATGAARGVAVVVDGAPGHWVVDAAALEPTSEFCGRTSLLSPFDRLVYDRDRARDLFGFEYVLEMYKPAAKRRWGYFALPILHGDRLVGKLDAKADRKAGLLRVNAVHLEQGSVAHDDADDATDSILRSIEAEIAALAEWLGLELDR